MKGVEMPRYPRPVVTVDSVVFTQINKWPHVLLIKRGKAPFKDKWAIPGGHVEKDEKLEVAVARELFEETGVACHNLKLLSACGDPGRDPRGWYITLAYTGSVSSDVKLRVDDDAAEAKWFPIERVADLPLAFDHRKVLGLAIAQTQSDDMKTFADNLWSQAMSGLSKMIFKDED